MLWGFGLTWILLWGTIGSFGTAYLHERTGRDVQMGGLLGLVVGGALGIFGLVWLWMWVYYGNSYQPVGRMYNPKRRWYTWYN